MFVHYTYTTSSHKVNIWMIIITMRIITLCVFQGKYFGPSSPCDDNSLSTDLSEAGSEALAKHYLADASASYNHGDEGVSYIPRIHTLHCHSQSYLIKKTQSCIHIHKLLTKISMCSIMEAINR